MDWVRSGLGARNPRTAARNAAWIYLVSAAVTGASNLLLPMPGHGLAAMAAYASPFALIAFGALLVLPRLPDLARDLVLSVTALVGVGFVVLLDLITRDASAGAQVMMLLPALFAASQLKPLGAAIGATACVAGDAAIVFTLRRNSGGLLDVIDFALVIGLMTGLLVLAGRRQDRLVEMLQAQAALDPLTGLVTRRVLDEAMQKAVAGARPMIRQAPDGTYQEQGTALILVDLDNFKTINDTYGHPVGDDALVHVANLLTRNARLDTVVARLGGDEMAVLVPRCGADTAQERAQEFLKRVLDHPLPLPDAKQLVVSVSVGVGHTGCGRIHLRDLYAAADASLYEAKGAGRARVGQTRSAPSTEGEELDDLAGEPL